MERHFMDVLDAFSEQRTNKGQRDETEQESEDTFETRNGKCVNAPSDNVDYQAVTVLEEDAEDKDGMEKHLFLPENIDIKKDTDGFEGTYQTLGWTEDTSLCEVNEEVQEQGGRYDVGVECSCSDTGSDDLDTAQPEPQTDAAEMLPSSSDRASREKAESTDSNSQHRHEDFATLLPHVQAILTEELKEFLSRDLVEFSEEDQDVIGEDFAEYPSEFPKQNEGDSKMPLFSADISEACPEASVAFVMENEMFRCSGHQHFHIEDKDEKRTERGTFSPINSEIENDEDSSDEEPTESDTAATDILNVEDSDEGMEEGCESSSEPDVSESDGHDSNEPCGDKLACVWPDEGISKKSINIESRISEDADGGDIHASEEHGRDKECSSSLHCWEVKVDWSKDFDMFWQSEEVEATYQNVLQSTSDHSTRNLGDHTGPAEFSTCVEKWSSETVPSWSLSGTSREECLWHEEAVTLDHDFQSYGSSGQERPDGGSLLDEDTEEEDMEDHADSREEEGNWAQETARIEAFYRFYNDPNENEAADDRVPKVQFCLEPVVSAASDEYESTDLESEEDSDALEPAAQSQSEESEPEGPKETNVPPHEDLQETSAPENTGSELEKVGQDVNAQPETLWKKNWCLGLLKSSVKMGVVIAVGVASFWWAADYLVWDA
ncbi:uncharacterized protein LOC114797783 isoform X2 [Denticeps clupeoides]|uniref:uncharacterized protein LOC114797783 isoform X2 n=1 Tax=Denticeps clupeoides TaxID=299321 RepID=UPI0010A3799A|nr:uncharacterized protein LOC114797783 isoform X2 [Denticeps clupeoides]